WPTPGRGRDILVVVPSHVFGQVLRQIKPLMRSETASWPTPGRGRDILVVVPSHVFGQVLRQIKPLMRS
ncbi:hypothetical protein CQA77_30455, partial [Klebsiella pneumoniae]